MKITLIILCLLTMTTIGCKSKVEAPPRPPLVPATAVWAGGVDGGDFFECDVDEKHSVNRCLIYNDSTGDVPQVHPYNWCIMMWGRDQRLGLRSRLVGMHRISEVITRHTSRTQVFVHLVANETKHDVAKDVSADRANQWPGPPGSCTIGPKSAGLG